MEFQLQNELQNLESEQELFKLTSGVELLSLPSKSSSSSWKMFHGSTTGDFNRNDQLISCCSTRPDFPSGFSDAECSSINLKQTNQPQQQQQQQQRDLRFVLSNSREGFFYGSNSVDDDLQHQQISQDGFLGKGATFHQSYFELKNSKFLIPTQELLSEFCNLSGKNQTNPSKHKSPKINEWKNDETCGTNSSSYSRKQSDLNSIDLVELQKRRAKLLSMLKEVDQRYRLYCDQIKALVSSMETVVGQGAATAYSTPASKAMSRHFRYLRDGILEQIKEIKEAMGEKDPQVIGPTSSTEGSTTPRLRVLDQRLRQQRSFYQNASMVERQPWRPQRGLPERSVTVLRAWLFEHFLHPYPSDVDKLILARQAGLSRSQVSNWFINARVRLWKPMVEEMYLEEKKEQQAQMLEHHHENINASTATGTSGNSRQNHEEDHQKPAAANYRYNQFVHLDDHSHSCIDLPSMIINNITNKGGDDHGGSGGVIDFDPSSYSHLHHTQAMLPLANYKDDHIHHHQNYRNGSVSLTLGLQQHGSSSTFLFPKDPIANIEDCKPFHQYSL